MAHLPLSGRLQGFLVVCFVGVLLLELVEALTS